jgi:hypothetical protein
MEQSVKPNVRGFPIGRLLAVWFVANFLIVGAASALAGEWYLGWKSRPLGILAELGLIQLPNLLLPLWLLRRGRPQSFGDLWDVLGWRWASWRTHAAGVIAFALSLGLSVGFSSVLGEPIPYHLPGEGGGIAANSLLALFGLLLFLLLFVGLTTVAEETMFRVLIQT